MSLLFQGAHLSVVTFVALYMTKEWPQTIRATWENVVYTHIVKDVTIGVECQGRLREVVARDFEGFLDCDRALLKALKLSTHARSGSSDPRLLQNWLG